ncbi:hypothetical protein LQQ62_14725 [Escherichia coli]|nr:hypothetical protein LQQ62_14725 [Escherichia coli]
MNSSKRAKTGRYDAKSPAADRPSGSSGSHGRAAPEGQYGDNPLALRNVMSEQKERPGRLKSCFAGSWMAGLKSGWGEWAESATDSIFAG